MERVVPLTSEQMQGFDVHRAFTDHGRAIFGFAVNATRDHEVAEDCVQETFTRAWRSREAYRATRGSERTWLFAIARNVIADALRARARRPAPVPEDHLESEIGAPSGSEAGSVLDRIVIHHALAALTPEHRQVVVSVQLDGLTYQQLSARTGVPTATLRTRMFYAMKALREHMSQEDHR